MSKFTVTVFRKNLVPFYKAFSVMALMSVILLVILFPFKFVGRSYLSVMDYPAFLTGGRIIAKGEGDRLYDLNTQIANQEDSLKLRGSMVLPFKTLPTAALFFAPFARFDLPTGYKVFYFVNLGFLAACMYLLNRIFKRPLPETLFYAILFPPVLSSLEIGQINIINFLLILLIYFFMRKNAYVKAGFVFSILLQKIQFLFLLPYLMIISKNRRDLTKGVVAGAGLQLLLWLPFIKLDTLLQYPGLILNTESAFYGSNTKNMSTFVSFLLDINKSAAGGIYLLAIGLLFYAALLVVFAKSVRRIKFENKFSVALLFFSASALHLWSHNLVYLLIPIFSYLHEIDSPEKIVHKAGKAALIIAIYAFTLDTMHFKYLTPLLMLALSCVFLTDKGKPTYAKA